MAICRDESPSKLSRVPNTALSRSLWVARPWPSKSFKRMAPTAVPQDPITCALLDEWHQQLFILCVMSCDQTWLLPSHRVSAMFVATAAKMCKHQGWQSEAVVPCILSLLDRGTQAPKERVFYSWLLDQSFGDRSPKDSPLSSSMYIWSRGRVLDEEY